MKVIETVGHPVGNGLQIGDTVALAPERGNGNGRDRFQIKEQLWGHLVSGPGVQSSVYYHGYYPADLTLIKRLRQPVAKGVR